MRILVAPDKFKGSRAAAKVAESIAGGLREALPAAEIDCVPMADGGEGTASVICAARGGEWHTCNVHDALGRPVTARYCTIDGGRTAVLETSEASGLWRIARSDRDVSAASAFGTGELLLGAARRGVKQIICGLGGSATNDGGFGMARALGFRFLDEAGAEIEPHVLELRRLWMIEASKATALPRVLAAADVANPLLGQRGATRIFAPQKGANAAELDLLESAMTQLADVAVRSLGRDHRDAFGAGAAGGLGFGLLTFCHATLRPGFEIVAEAVGLEALMRAADVVITGEGRLDAQTLEGKAPAGVARMARSLGKPVHAIVGELEASAGVRELFDVIEVASPAGMPLADAMAEAPALLRTCGRKLGRTLRV